MEEVKPPQPKEESIIKKHAKKHKKKYSAAAIVSIVIALLEAWPTICPILPFKLTCVDTRPLAEFGKSKVEELKDAGIGL